MCAGEDLNLHALRHMALNHACLPVPAPAQACPRSSGAGRIIIAFMSLSSKPCTSKSGAIRTTYGDLFAQLQRHFTLAKLINTQPHKEIA